jgi:hypothetical protein
MKLPLYPSYDKSSAVFWCIWVWFGLYLVGTILYVGLFAQNLSSVYTWFKNPGAPGTSLSSKRGTFGDVSIRLSIAANIIILGIICSWIMFRKNFGCNVIWAIFYFIMLLMTLLGIMGMGQMYSECNAQLQYGNLCNDLNWCCVNEIFANPLNGCPNVLPCAIPKTLNTLNPNQDFLGLFWLNFVLFLFQCGMLVFLMYSWSKSPTFDGGTTEEVGDFDQKEPPQPQVTPSPQVTPTKEESVVIEPVPELQKDSVIAIEIPSITRQQPTFRAHGLRNRK